jgi:ABC-2 type transport system permease protein
MSTLSVAKKDFLDVRRAKMVWFVCGMYTLLLGLLFYVEQRGNPNPDIRTALEAVTFLGALVIPLIALVAAYLAVAGERESGTIKYHLSLPVNRFDIVFGKFLSRAGVVSGAILLSFAFAAVLGVIWYPSLEAATFLRATLLTTIFTLTFVSIAVGISAMTTSRSRAMGGSIGTYFLTVLMPLFPGINVQNILDIVLNEFLSLGVGDDPIVFIQTLISPLMAFLTTWPWVFPESTQGPSEVAWYLEPNVTIFVLLAWLVVPLVLGYYVFERSDLG